MGVRAGGGSGGGGRGGGFVGGGWGVVVGGDVGVWCCCGCFGGGAVEGDGLHVAGGVVWDGVVEGGVEFLVRHFLGCLLDSGVVCSVVGPRVVGTEVCSLQIRLTGNVSAGRRSRSIDVDFKFGQGSVPPCLTAFSQNQGRLFGGMILSETERTETWETWKMEPGGIRH